MSDYWKNKNQDGEEGEEGEDGGEDEEELSAGDDRIIFLIDCRKPMLEKNVKGEIHLQNCLAVALEVIKSKIIASNKSSVGITMFGTVIAHFLPLPFTP